MNDKWKKLYSIIIAGCAIGGLVLGIWNIFLSSMFEERANIQIRDINITKFPVETFPESIDEECVYISIFNYGKHTAEDVTVDIHIDIPFYDYYINSKEEYTVEWGGENRNSLGLHFPKLLGNHGIGITLRLKNSFLINNSVEPTVKIYEGGHGLVASHYAPVLTV